MAKNSHKKWLDKLGFQETEIYMGMFDYSINFVVGKHDNLGTYVAFKLDDPDYEEDLAYEPRGRCIYRSGYRPIIWIPRKPRTPREHVTLAHECLHAMWHVTRWAGIPLDDSTEEVITHGMAHIYTKALESFKK